MARAPTRLDFGGGWTDVPPYSVEEGGFVCNAAIDRYAVVTLSRPVGTGTTPTADDADRALVAAALRRQRVQDIQVSLRTGVPMGAGLGGSSACGVAVLGALAAWQGRVCAGSELAEASRRLEVDDLGIAGGRQDHYAAVLGGALALEFGSETQARRLALSGEVRAALERRCIVAYTGQSRISGETISAVLHAYRRHDRQVIEALARMKSLAREMAVSVESGDLDTLGVLVGEHWIHQRSLHPAIPTPLIDHILSTSLHAGALGGKALGASGGGCVLIVAPEGLADHIRGVVRDMATLLDFHIDTEGFHVDESSR